MATIGNLVVELTSNSSKLRRGLTKAQRSIGKFAKKAANTIKSIGKAFAFISAAAIGGFLVAINKTAAGIDRLAKLAPEMGITVAELQKMQFAFEQTGVSAEQGTDAIVKMMKNIAEAATGVGEAKDEIEALGLSAEALRRMSAQEQFKAISEALKGIGNQSDRVLIAMKIFGRGGRKILNTLQADVAGLGKEFEALGISLTQQQAKNVEAFQDMKNVLGSLFKGFFQQVTAEVVPAFTTIIQFIKDSIIEMGGMRGAAQSFARFVIRGVIGAIRGFRDLIGSLKNVQLNYQKVIFLAAKASDALSLGTLFSDKELQKMADDIFALEKSIGQAGDSAVVIGLNKLLQKLEKSFEASTLNTGDVQAAVQKSTMAQNELAKSALAAATALDAGVGEKGGGATAFGFGQGVDVALKNITAGNIFAESSLISLEKLAERFQRAGGQGFTSEGKFGSVDMAAMNKTIENLRDMFAKKFGDRKDAKATIEVKLDKGLVVDMINSGKFTKEIAALVIKQTNNAARAGAGG